MRVGPGAHAEPPALMSPEARSAAVVGVGGAGSLVVSAGIGGGVVAGAPGAVAAGAAAVGGAAAWLWGRCISSVAGIDDGIVGAARCRLLDGRGVVSARVYWRLGLWYSGAASGRSVASPPGSKSGLFAESDGLLCPTVVGAVVLLVGLGEAPPWPARSPRRPGCSRRAALAFAARRERRWRWCHSARVSRQIGHDG